MNQSLLPTEIIENILLYTISDYIDIRNTACICRFARKMVIISQKNIVIAEILLNHLIENVKSKIYYIKPEIVKIRFEKFISYGRNDIIYKKLCIKLIKYVIKYNKLDNKCIIDTISNWYDLTDKYFYSEIMYYASKYKNWKLIYDIYTTFNYSVYINYLHKRCLRNNYAYLLYPKRDNDYYDDVYASANAQRVYEMFSKVPDYQYYRNIILKIQSGFRYENEKAEVYFQNILKCPLTLYELPNQFELPVYLSIIKSSSKITRA